MTPDIKTYRAFLDSYSDECEYCRHALRYHFTDLLDDLSCLIQERDETLMLAEHPEISNLRDLARELVCRAQRIIEFEGQRRMAAKLIRDLLNLVIKEGSNDQFLRMLDIMSPGWVGTYLKDSAGADGDQ